MAQRINWAHAVTAIGLVGALAACSNPGARTSSASAKIDPSKIGMAMRAQAALAANDLPTALSLGEAAVEYRPGDSSFRSLLGNIYLAAGRYASAERSYHDALTLAAPDPQVVLKYALVQMAQGKTDAAVAMLTEAQSILDVTDLGLALALAGRSNEAISVLEPAARMRGADARTRQNLALAYALGGDWEAARTVASQDLAADQVETRIAEWMAMARPGQAQAQVAAFIGIQPIANDPGQPVRLALAKPQGAVRSAAIAVPTPARVAYVAPLAAAAFVAPPAPVAIVAPEPEVAAAIQYVVPPEPRALEAAPPARLMVEQPVKFVEAVKEVLAPMVEAFRPAPRKVAVKAPRPALSPAAVRLTASLAEHRRNAALKSNSHSRTVVQLGAYDSRSLIAGAWSKAAGRHAALRGYTPVTARFAAATGTFYRLSVKGFANDREATSLCNSLKRAGASCFVRAAYNDMPIQLASR